MLAKPVLRLILLIAAAGAAQGTESVAVTEPVARVGKRVISRAMLDDAVNQALNATYRHSTLSRDGRRELEQTQLNELVRRELNLAGALDHGLELPSADAEASRAAIEQRLGADGYATALAVAGLTRESHARAIAETLLAHRAYREFVLRPAEVSDDAIRTAYAAAADQWRMPETAHVLHILLVLRPEADAAEVARVDTRARELAERAREGDDFRTLAAENSEDMYRIKGGDLGWVHRGRLVGELETAVWGAEIGTIIGPVRSAEGYHLATVLARRPARAMEYPEVEPMLREQLATEKLEAAEEAWFGPLHEAHPVVIIDPALAVEAD